MKHLFYLLLYFLSGQSARVDSTTFSMETALSKASKMFSYLRNKDIFVDAYRKQLAKRLLTLKSRDGGVAENDAISLLKERMGAAFTAKLEGMMLDITNNNKRHSEFQNYLSTPEEIVRMSRAGALHDEMGESVISPTKSVSSSINNLDFSPSRPPSIGYDMRVQLLTNGHWPTTKNLSFDLPKSMRQAQAVFEKFYMIVTANRKLRWAHALGTVVVEGNYYGDVTIEIAMSELQCAILLCMSSKAVVGGGITMRALQTMLGGKCTKRFVNCMLELCLFFFIWFPFSLILLIVLLSCKCIY